jgi:acyl-CoA reductase-like NAD-dependent aldehyde dehydrogenase
MASEQTTIIPHSQQPYVTRTYPTSDQVDATIVASAAAQEKWKLVPLKERMAIGSRFLEEMKKNGDVIAKELTLQVGR